MEYGVREFDNMFLHIHKLKKGQSIWKKFPVLNLHLCFKQQIARLSYESVIKYVVYAFDRNSPFMSITDEIERRVEAALMAGWTLDNKGEFSAVVEDIIRFRNVHANVMIITYCILHSGDDYSTLVSYREAHRRQTLKLFEGDNDDESTKDLIGNIERLRENIAKIRKDLLHGTRDPMLEKSLYDYMEAKSLGLSPEHYASKNDSFPRPTNVVPGGGD